MKHHPLRITLAASLVLVLACAGVVLANLVQSAGADGAAATARTGVVTLGAALTQTKVLAGPASGSTPPQAGLALTLRCEEVRPAKPADRNVDLVVVLDRSGSMAGSKLRDARDAVAELLRALGPGDRFALVSYAGDVTVHGLLSPVDAQTRPGLVAQAMSIHAGGGTNLGGGLAAGLELLSQVHRSGQRTASLAKVILISDGHANQGVVDPLALGHMAAQAYRTDAGVTTVGVGVDYNENLMGTIADHGGGNYYFLEHPAQFASLFLEELSLTRAVAARSLEVRLPLPPGMTLADAAGYPFEMEDNVAVLRPGYLRSGQQRTIFLTLGLDPDSQPGRRYDLLDIAALWQHGDHRQEAILRGPLSVTTVANRAVALASIDPALWADQTVQEDYNRLREEVAHDVAQGNRNAAMTKIDRYEREKRALNADIRSVPVAENLDQDLPELRRTVETTLAPTATDQMRKQASKAMQAESYDIRRSKVKQ